MKKVIGCILCLLLVTLCVFALADVEISESNFPDSVFREYVKIFDEDQNNSFSDEEIAQITTINVESLGISSLQGIENFTALTKLASFDNTITALDVSKNLALTDLHVSANQLMDLDVSNNTELNSLACSGNQLTSLDTSHNTKLTSLECYGNRIESLDLSQNTALTHLWCGENSFTSLDVSRNTALQWLYCYNAPITALDLHNNPELTMLLCEMCKLTTLDLYNNPLLEELYCDNCQLTSLDISKNTALKILACYGNELKILDVSKVPTLNNLVKETSPVETYSFLTWEDIPDGNRIEIDKRVQIITDEGIYGGDNPVTAITLNKTKATMTRTSRTARPILQLKAAVSPEDATDPSVEWISSNRKVAIVDENGKVTAIKNGTAVITCTAKDGSGVTASCKITVKNKLVTRITLNKTKVTIKKGKTFQLKVKAIKPTDAFNQKVTWKSSNKKIATVDKNGKVKAVRKGTCTITCTAADGSRKKVICMITVK